MQPLTAGFRHTSLDIAAFLPQIDSAESNLTTVSLTLLANDVKFKIGDCVTIAGFSSESGNGVGSRKGTPTCVKGMISELRPSRAFIDTGVVYPEMGMCGGPVVLSNDRSVCIGMLEGLVPLNELENSNEGHPHMGLQGRSVVILATELRNFLLDIEEEVESA